MLHELGQPTPVFAKATPATLRWGDAVFFSS
jgi:hypothetical protein